MQGYPLLNVFLSTLYFFCWILWLMLLFWIIWDIFRSRDLGGWAKAGWLVLVIVVPLLGVLVYLIARGGTMHERQVREARAQDDAIRAYVRDTADIAEADGHSPSNELAKLAALHDRGVLDDQEFEQAKARILM
jgi:Short C-terminal domain/Phospholipase_D-nuclease N-terminal